MCVKHLIQVIILVGCLTVHGQANLTNSARSLSMSNASVTLTDVWAQVNNPAALVGIKKHSFGLAYQNRFGLKELQSQGFVYAFPLKNTVISAGSQWYGYQQFRTVKNSAGISMLLSEKVSMGLKMNHHLIKLNENYGAVSRVSADLGLLVKFTSNLTFGVGASNIGRTKVSSNLNERLTTSLRIGLAYKLSDQLCVLTEIEKNVIMPIQVKFGTEYIPHSNWFFRGGFSTAPLSFSFGCGGRFKERFQFDLGTAYHAFLGWSPHVSFQFEVK